MSKLNEIKEYYKKIGFSDDKIESLIHHSVYLSTMIATYAHNGQKRINFEPYINHPLRVYENYKEFIGLELFGVDEDLLGDLQIPFDGVQELCLLHDVIEKTSISLVDLYEIFEECDLERYFNTYMKQPLELLTRSKKESYKNYFNKILDNPIASMVKMMEFRDNSNLLSLTKIDKEDYVKSANYMTYMLDINFQYRFVERVYTYRKMMNENKIG